jgi:hypothetical protein
MGRRVADNSRICIDQITVLGGGAYSIRLTVQGPEGALSQTQTVSAPGPDAAIQIAKQDFARWLEKVRQYTVRNLPANMRN